MTIVNALLVSAFLLTNLNLLLMILRLRRLELLFVDFVRASSKGINR